MPILEAVDSTQQPVATILAPIYKQANKVCITFLAIHLLLAFVMAAYYSTWRMAAAIGVPALLFPVVLWRLAPLAFVTRMAVGISLQTFCALHIYQMHGMPEMHFFFFTAVTAMIAYQDFWAIVPGVFGIILQHLIFAYLTSPSTTLCFYGGERITVTKLTYHFGIATAQVVLAGTVIVNLRARTIDAYNQRQTVSEREQAIVVLNHDREELAAISDTDGLTGVANRRHFNRRFSEMFHGGLGRGTNVHLMMLDVDHFKRYNDRYGHPSGDTCLRLIAAVLRRVLHGEQEFAFRYGGEEFGALLVDVSVAYAVSIAERIRRSIQEEDIEHTNRDDGLDVVTVSIGLATAAIGDGTTQESLLDRADNSLYAAKRKGRNRVMAVDSDRAVETPARLTQEAVVR